MRATAKDTRIVEVYASTAGSKVRLVWRTWWHKLGTAERLDQQTRMVIATMPVPLTNDDLSKYAEAMARFCVDPRRRAFRPPNALVWREVAFGQDETGEHGEQRDGRGFIQDLLPLDGGSTATEKSATILTAAKAEEGSRAKRVRSSAREPSIRNLTTGKQSSPGG